MNALVTIKIRIYDICTTEDLKDNPKKELGKIIRGLNEDGALMGLCNDDVEVVDYDILT